MPRTRNPRRGSMQFWPRKRAARATARVRTWAAAKDAKPLGFAGYKAGMTHIMIADNLPNSMTKGEEISMPVTVIECPPMKVAAINFYANAYGGSRLADTILAPSLDKNVHRLFPIPKTYAKTPADVKVENLHDVRILAVTQPHLIGLKKTPEAVEIALGGKLEEKLAHAKTILGKELNINEIFAEGAQLDMHSVTTGRGTIGPVARFGVDIRSHKSQKTIRGPGSVGPWRGNRSWQVSHAGQHGYHRRTEINKWLLKIGTNPADMVMKGGFKHYGILKSNYILVKGSIGGPVKRLITFTQPVRPNHKIPNKAPAITYTSLASKQ